MARTRALIAAAAVIVARRAAAQQAPALRPSVAATAVVGTHALGLVSVGLEGDAGAYARLALTAGVGTSTVGNGRAVGELAAIGRFLLDPLRQSSRGVYATGGLALRVERTTRPRALVLAGLGLEGSPVGRVIPAIEAGVGGGARLSVVLRPVRPGRR